MAADYEQCRQGGGGYAKSTSEPGDTLVGAGAFKLASRRASAAYKRREAGCGTGAKAEKNRPFSYCDRVLLDAGTATAACPYTLSAGGAAAGAPPVYASYKSLALCPTSDHSAVVADVALSWTPAAAAPAAEPAPASDGEEHEQPGK